MDNDKTQLFKMEGRHVHWLYDQDLCLDAKNRYNGDKLANVTLAQAYTARRATTTTRTGRSSKQPPRLHQGIHLPQSRPTPV